MQKPINKTDAEQADLIRARHGFMVAMLVITLVTLVIDWM